MKKLLLLLFIALIAANCKKENHCYVCSTFNERTYDNGGIKKDTFKAQVCNDEDFIKAYIKNGTFNGPYSEVKDGETIHYNLNMSTVCNRK